MKLCEIHLRNSGHSSSAGAEDCCESLSSFRLPLSPSRPHRNISILPTTFRRTSYLSSPRLYSLTPPRPCTPLHLSTLLSLLFTLFSISYLFGSMFYQDFHGYNDAILYASCFDANAGIFEAILNGTYSISTTPFAKLDTAVSMYLTVYVTDRV